YRRIESATFDEDALKDRLGIRDFAPCGGDSFLEALMYHPQLNISGIHAGYGGDGNKNIVPSKATVKFDMRLVPDQDPDTVFEDVVRHVRQLDRGVAEVDIDRLEKNSRRNGPSETPLSSPFVGVVEEAVADVWGVRPNVFQRSGASGPIDVFERHLDVPHVNVPYGSPASRRHGPDENISIGYFLNGIRTSIGVMDRVSRMADAAD
ncbi:MAG: M20/M25/M40 family metallo-hydrolase, partial [Halobacteriales archaeon]|nr:M20/M25/M40 family metallo-hydrolase [Halobacteriales archaeon]